MSADASRLRDALDSWAYAVQAGAVDDVPDLVRPLAPLGVSTPTSDREPGQLRASLTVSEQVNSGGPQFRGKVAAPVPQAVWTDQGTLPHEIVPRGPGYPLRFYWPKVGGIVRFMRVNHPGNAAQNWWEPSVRMAYTQALLARAVSTPFAA